MTARRINKAGRLVFVNGYERMAYVALELLTKNQTQAEMAETLQLSHQRVGQIYIAALARVGCTSKPDAATVGLRYRNLLRSAFPVDTVEHFAVHELVFRGKFHPFGAYVE